MLLRDVLKQEGKLRLPRRQLSSDAAFTVTARNQRGDAAHAAALAALAAAVITAHFSLHSLMRDAGENFKKKKQKTKKLKTRRESRQTLPQNSPAHT